MRAASSMSSGIESAYCRMRKIPKMLAIPGMITPQYVLIKWRFFIRRKSGSIATCTGSTRPSDRMRNVRSRPRNLSLANAYPASELITSDTAVTITAINALLNR